MELSPIGVIRSPFQQATGTPIQSRAAEGVEGTVEIFPRFVAGLKDLEGFERIWLLYWFDRSVFEHSSLILRPYPLPDIKPYVAQFYCFAVTSSGWFEGLTVWQAMANSRFEKKK